MTREQFAAFLDAEIAKAAKLQTRQRSATADRSSQSQKQKAAAGSPAAAFKIVHRDEVVSVLGRPGSDLLFQALRLSTIGAGEFNGRVRDGIGFRLPANTTRPAKDG